MSFLFFFTFDYSHAHSTSQTPLPTPPSTRPTTKKITQGRMSLTLTHTLSLSLSYSLTAYSSHSIATKYLYFMFIYICLNALAHSYSPHYLTTGQLICASLGNTEYPPHFPPPSHHTPKPAISLSLYAHFHRIILTHVIRIQRHIGQSPHSYHPSHNIIKTAMLLTI